MYFSSPPSKNELKNKTLKAMAAAGLKECVCVFVCWTTFSKA